MIRSLQCFQPLLTSIAGQIHYCHKDHIYYWDIPHGIPETQGGYLVFLGFPGACPNNLAGSLIVECLNLARFEESYLEQCQQKTNELALGLLTVDLSYGTYRQLTVYVLYVCCFYLFIELWGFVIWDILGNIAATR